MKKYALLALLLCLALCLPALAAADEAKPMLDIVWVVDCTGSMNNFLSTVNSHLAEFAAKLTDFDVQYGLVGFGDEINTVSGGVFTYPEETVSILWNGSQWTDDLNVLKNSMVLNTQSQGGLPFYYGGKTPQETSTCGIYMAATQYEWRENAVRAIVLVTDYYAYIGSGTSTITGKSIRRLPDCVREKEYFFEPGAFLQLHGRLLRPAC